MSNKPDKSQSVKHPHETPCYVPPAQTFSQGKELDHVKCLCCGRIHFVEKGQPLPEIGWCECSDNESQ